MTDVNSHLNGHRHIGNGADGMGESAAREYPETTADSDSSQGKLRSYTKAKLAVAAQLRGLLEVLKKRGGESRANRCEELMVKLAEDRFTLAVLGQFKRGKSSLMNALIGRELLPTGVLPLTSAITILKFGPSERLVILRERMQFPDVVPVSELAAFVTEKGNPGNFKKVKTATVEVPLPFLRRGLEFVDTPGVGSSIQANTNTTYGFLPECDAALFVTSVETPFTNIEVEFLRIIREHMRKIFFVVNKIDLLASESERAEVLKIITHTIRQELDVRDPRILPVSSREGLNALLRHDNEGYSRSGMQRLQETLGGFLSEEKTSVLLVAIIDRTIRVLDEESGELAIYRSARALPESRRTELLERLKTDFLQQGAIRDGIFSRLRHLTIDRTIDFTAPEIESELRRQYKQSLGVFDRLPPAARWLPTQWFLQDYAKRLGHRLQRKLWRKTVSRLGLLSFDSTAEIQALWRQIGTSLDRLPALATSAFDLPHTQSSTEEESFYRIELNPEASLPPSTSWTPVIPRWLSWLPVAFVRSIVKRGMAQQTDSFVEAAKNDSTNRITELANNAVNRVVEQTTKLAEEAEARITASITGQRPPRPASQQGFAPLEELGWGNSALESIRSNLLILRDSLTHVESDEPPLLEEVPIPSQIVKMPAPRPIESSMAKDLKSRGCPVCDHLVNVAYNFFVDWQYVLGTDEKAQTDFAKELGFCPLHTWQLTAISSPLGGSIGFAKLTTHISRLLSEAAKTSNAAPNLRRLLRGGANCRVCSLLRGAEDTYIRRFEEFLTDASNREIYSGSQGLCLRHLSDIVPILRDEYLREFVLKTAARHFEETAEDMQGYAIKRGATRRSLLNSDENDAWWRAVTHLSGGQHVCAPWPDDAEI